MDDIRDIKGILYFKEINWLLVIASALVLAAIIFFLYKMIKKRSRPKTPFELALKELDEAKGVLGIRDDIKEYYIRISDAVRRYIESVFNLKAPEMTTEEFLASLESAHKFSKMHNNLLKEFLRSCDLVKFAKYAPTKNEIDNVYTCAKKFLEDTNVRV